MSYKGFFKTIIIIFLVDLISNVGLLLFLGEELTQQHLITTALFTLILFLILNQSKVLKYE
jgi:hypothetical protein